MKRSIIALTLDPSAWVDRHGDHLYRFALSRVKDADAAEELVQDALLAALTVRHDFRGDSSERTWLTAILKRKIVDRLRKVVRQRSRQEPMPDARAGAMFTRSGKWSVKPGEWSPDDPGSELNRAEFHEVLSECLRRLPTRLRDAFVLRHIDEASADEVREALGATPNNLWVMLHRARLQLWRCLTVRWFGEEPETRTEVRT